MGLFSFIGDAVSSVAGVVGDVVGGAASVVGGVIGGVIGGGGGDTISQEQTLINENENVFSPIVNINGLETIGAGFSDLAAAQQDAAQLGIEGDRIIAGALDGGALDIAGALDGAGVNVAEALARASDSFTESVDGAGLNLAFAGVVGVGIIALTVLLDD